MLRSLLPHEAFLKPFTGLAAVLVVGAASLSAPALAAPGDHIRAGDSTFTPGIDLGAEYRTNLYRTEIDPSGGANLRIAPQATFVVGGEDHEFKSGGIWELRKFLFVNEVVGSSSNATGAERVANLDRFNDFGVNFGTSLFKREVVGIELADTMNMRNNSTDADFSDTPFTSQFRNKLSGALRISPGPALALTPGGTWSFDQYRVPPDGNDDRLLNTRHTYGPSLGAKWAFLPRTALYANGSYMVNSWQDGPVLTSQTDPLAVVPNSQFINSMVGIDGRFTKKLFLDIGAGYGVGLYDGGTNASGLAGLLAKVQGRYQILEAENDNGGTALTVGYEKTFRDSFFTNFSEINRVFAGFNAGVGNFRPALRYEIRFEGYDGSISRDDIVNKFSADAGYKIQKWASIVPGVSWQQRASNVDTVEYDDVNIHLLANFTY